MGTLYDYQCDTCGEVFEILEQRMERTHVGAPCLNATKCPGVLKVYIGSPPPVAFKGSGWPGKHNRSFSRAIGGKKK